MAIGLASMNPIPCPQLGVVMIHDKPMDKDTATTTCLETSNLTRC